MATSEKQSLLVVKEGSDGAKEWEDTRESLRSQDSKNSRRSTPVETSEIIPTRQRNSDFVEAALLQGEAVSVERVRGRTVFLKNNIYTKTNFYIQESRPYFSASLTKYINVWGHQWYFLGYFIAGCITPIDPIYALIWFFLGIPFFFLYLQHMYVNVTTMPWVLRQPSLPDRRLDHDNAFFKISFSNYVAIFGETDEASFVGMRVQGGRIKVQAFKRSAKWRMIMCVVVSTLCFCASIWTMDYCLAWFVVFYDDTYV